MNNRNKKLLPYYEKARDTLKYNPESGEIFRYIKSRNRYEVAGAINGNGYGQVSIVLDGLSKKLLSHRVAWFITYEELPIEFIDHKDGNKMNNSISNLRACTNQENQFNRSKDINSSTGFKGVAWNKASMKYQSKLGYNGKVLHLGMFDCPKEASEAYEAKSKELFGDFYAEEA